MAGSSKAGGAAMAGGERFQARVTAWYAARILLQTSAIGQEFDLPATSIAERIYCETKDSVDDLRVELTGKERIYGQCKTSLSLSTTVKSEWASVLIQFYEELERISSTGGERRFVLFYQNNNGNLEKLSAVLKRYRQLPNGTPLINAAFNEDEEGLVNNLNNLLDALQATPELAGLATRREDLLRHSYIKQLRLGVNEGDYLGVVDALHYGLLTNSADITQVLNSLHTLADDLLAERGSRDRLALRQKVQGEGVTLRDSANYRLDFERLEEWTATEIETHETQGRAKLTIAGKQLPISRPVVEVMIEAAKTQSFLVIGGAGTGKTGCLLTLANQLRASGGRVWYWAAESLPYHSPQEIETYLHLQHSWMGLLAEAASGAGATLIIDGLDGLRNTRALRAYQKLFGLAINRGVRVIASIRSFDLQYSGELPDIFPAGEQPISPEFCNPGRKSVNHIVISELDDEELNQVVNQFPEVQAVLNELSQLQKIIRNLFSLDLFGQLIAEGESAAQLSGISTQAELFERYWEQRVDLHERREEITEALQLLVQQMVEQQTLQVVPDQRWTTQLKNDLFSPELVRKPSPTSGRLPRPELVEFNHHLLFDYAAERLFVRQRWNQLASELAYPDTWGLFLRPSVVLFHSYAWNQGRLDFWDTLIELERSSVPVLQKLPGYLVVAEEANYREDLQPLLDGILRKDSDTTYWLQIVKGVIAAATFSSLPKRSKSASGDWWIEFARDLIYTGNPQLVYASREILFSVSFTIETLSAQSKLLLNQAAVALLQFHWRENAPPSSIIRLPIECVCRTISSNLSASSEIIRRIISNDELRRAGYVQTFEVVTYIKDIWEAAPALAVEVYEAIFGYVETEQSATAMYPSKIFTLSSNRKQDYELAYHVLAEKFPLFLCSYPTEATHTLIRIVRQLWNRERIQKESRIQRLRELENLRSRREIGREENGGEEHDLHFLSLQQLYTSHKALPPTETFIWDSQECRLQPDRGYVWENEDEYSNDQTEMLQAWEDYLVALPTKDQANQKWQAISDIVATENELAAVWKRLLIAASRNPAFYAKRLWTILLNPAILVGADTQKVAEDCIETFIAYLTDEEIREIESTILSIAELHVQGSDTAEAFEHYLSSIHLLRHLPEEKRSAATREILAKRELKLLQLRSSENGINENNLTRNNVNTANRKEQELLQRAEFLLWLSAKDITDENITSILVDIRQLEQILVESSNEVDTELASEIKEKLVSGFTELACSQANLDKQLIDELCERFKNILALPAKVLSPQDLEQFDRSSSWSWSNSRMNAAKGLVSLAIKTELLADEWKDLLRRVADDPDPIVRYYLGLKIWLFLDNWPEFVWETLERWVSELPSRIGTLGVLQKTLGEYWFFLLRNNDANRADQLLRNLLRETRSLNLTKFRSHCGKLLAALWFSEGEAWAGDTLISAITSIRDNKDELEDELEGAVCVAVKELLPRLPREPNPVEERQRALDFLLLLLSEANHTVRDYSEQLAALPLSDRPNELPPWGRKIAQLFDYMAREFHFCAEEYVKQWATAQTTDRETQVRVWWETIERILDALLAMPHPGFVFSVIQGLELLVNLDVQRSLHWMRKATLASVPAGLANESLAADRTIEILRRILAEHKTSLAKGDELRSDFVQILEAYLQAGWPKAVQLAVQIDSIFRF